MARNGSGTYVKVGDNVVFDTVISETYYNNQINDLVTALTQSVSKDGQTTITGNLNMGSKKLTAMAVGTASTDSLTLGQAQANAFGYVASDSGSSNAYVIAPSPAITGYAAGQKFAFKAANVSSGASTLNVSGLGVKNVYYQNAAISGAMIKAGALILVVYDGTQFQMLSPANTFLSGTVAIANGGTGATSAAAAATALGVGTGNSPQFAALDVVGVATATTFEPDGNTAAGDNAAIGFTAGEGLILTGQGSTNDVTIKNDANADVIEIPTGTTDVTVAGKMTAGKVVLAATDTDTSNTGSITLDFSAHQNFVLTLTGSITLANPSTESVGQSGIITLIQDGTGSRTLSLGTDYETPAGEALTISTAANAVDVIPYFVKASGSIQLGAPQLAFS